MVGLILATCTGLDTGICSSVLHCEIYINSPNSIHSADKHFRDDVAVGTLAWVSIYFAEKFLYGPP